MGESLTFVPVSHDVLSGPEDVGSERRWRVRLRDGRRAVVGRLSPELARDESIRRRYVRDVRRVQALQAHSLAPLIATGPQPDPLALDAEPPWRMRQDPDGEPLSVWLARAPAPLDEVSRVGAALADAVHAIHGAGGVLRDLSPRNLVRTPDERVVLTDVGLSRVDLLSSHTASSLLLEGSPYGSPEQLLSTVVDQRSDLFGLGVILWRALTGTFPYGEDHALLREYAPLPALTELRPEVPAAVDQVVRRCLHREPESRPESAAELSWVLRGGGTQLALDAHTTCQQCGSRLRVGQRLCPSCGQVATKYEHLAPGDRKRFGLELVSATEDAGHLARLRDFVRSIAAGRVGDLEFLIGDPMMYSDEERSTRTRLPARLFNDLPESTARELHQRMEERGLDVRLIDPGALSRKLGAALGIFMGAVGGVIALVTLSLGGFAVALGIAGFIATVLVLSTAMTAMNERDQPALFRLRPTPAALPASDPLVARLSKLGHAELPADVRMQVGEMALLIQRLVDHRAKLEPHLVQEIELLTAPAEPLVGLIEQQVEDLVRISADLQTLDEADMVRALAASEARGEAKGERQPIFDGLDRLRTLEDARASAFHRLLEASDLLRRSVNLGLEVGDPKQVHENHVKLALAALSGEN
jgi:hypothetical protein